MYTAVWATRLNSINRSSLSESATMIGGRNPTTRMPPPIRSVFRTTCQKRASFQTVS